MNYSRPATLRFACLLCLWFDVIWVSCGQINLAFFNEFLEA